MWQNLIDKVSQSQDLLKQIIDTLHASEFFSSVRTDKGSHFWVTYERIAMQTDEEFLERYNGDLDVQLIFVRDVYSLHFSQNLIHILIGWSLFSG